MGNVSLSALYADSSLSVSSDWFLVVMCSILGQSEDTLQAMLYGWSSCFSKVSSQLTESQLFDPIPPSPQICPDQWRQFHNTTVRWSQLLTNCYL